MQAHTGKEKATQRVIRVKLVSEAGEEIIGAKVSLNDESQKAVFTDINGYMQLQLNAQNATTIRIDAIGFKPKTLNIQDLQGFSEITLNPLSSQM